MPDKQHTFGQFTTPLDVADILMGFCLRRPTDRLLDPGCGHGALLARAAQWQDWLTARPKDIPPHSLWGVELDEATAVHARAQLPQATILAGNFFALALQALTPQTPFDAIIGNPPYTRAEWIDRLSTDAARQLAFAWGASGEEPRLIPPELTAQLDRRTGLHGYFLLHSASFLREGGRLGFIVPNSWLDVAYGTALKQFLLDHFKVVAVVESGIERWFNTAKVNTCLLALEKCSGPNRRAANVVRLVRLKRPLANLFPAPQDDYRRMQVVERLITRLLASHDADNADFTVRVQPQADLSASARWGMMLRAPTVLRKPGVGKLPPLKKWAIIQRGHTTGANNFFYLSPKDVQKWGIEPQFRHPLLKSLRGMGKLRLSVDDCRHDLLVIPPAANLQGTAVADYIAWGEDQGVHLRRTCVARHPWYSLPAQPSAQLVFPKGIWRRYSTPLLDTPLPIDQQLYQIRLAVGVPLLAAAALLNSTWFMLQCELRGRVNFGAGLLWLARYELADARLPDPRTLSPLQINHLSDLFTVLAERPCQPIETELSQPDRQALDTAVFDILGLDEGEQTAVYTALLDRVQTRRRAA
ncbi:MAG: SAM-dependent DNA methyltransferase [Ardenticatenaceae bacterium]|nr:SAM-dependent DNA methyltransferase [Anaerolineales bacterium]MCB8922383.1 SAM-dependent DNA methyltransferase [Ardenticatenaceae bacterium]MCB8991315.1 SAM-dependent DNA methyltransferase [Ardenticatenaceae bacterium]